MKKHLPLIIVLILVTGSIYYLESGKVKVSSRTPESKVDIQVNQENKFTIDQKAKKYQLAKEIVRPGQFFNTKNNQPITIQELIGKKVILVDFWTYSCINCQRTTPYLNAWHEKYADEGLVILGLHSPEFDFEKNPENVQEAIDRFKIKYPVIQDNDFGTWRAYQNRYWPRKYLIDIDGYVVYDHIGEGAYDSTEKKIQNLLKERADRLGESVDFEMGSLVDPDNPQKVSSGKISPETYFGAWRNDRLANGVIKKEGSQFFKLEGDLEDNQLYLEGEWSIAQEFAENKSKNASIVFPFQAQDVFMVLSSDEPVQVKVKVDGKLIDPSMSGDDVDKNGVMTVQKEKLYKIIKNGDSNTFKNLELEIQQPGLRAFTFTFG